MPGLLEILRAAEAGRVWIDLPGRTSSESKIECHKKHQGAEGKAKTAILKMIDHRSLHIELFQNFLNFFATKVVGVSQEKGPENQDM